MPRCARTLCESGIYHVMLRGNNKDAVFSNEEDKNKMVEILLGKRDGGAFFLYAYCVMDNHLHLVLKEGTDHLSKALKRIATSYAYYYNKRYNRVGHVFQDRYRSECIHDDSYLLSAIRYVHQNPQKAGIGTMEQYKWSSYHAYMQGGEGNTEMEEILDMISTDRSAAIKEFARFNREVEKEEFMDVQQETKASADDAKRIVEKFLREHQLTLEDLKHSGCKGAVEELVRKLYNVGLSLREVSRILGLNREMVRIMSKKSVS